MRDVGLHGGLDLTDWHVRLDAPAHNRRRLDIEVGSTVIEVKRDLTRGLQAAQDQLVGLELSPTEPDLPGSSSGADELPAPGGARKE